MTSVYHRTDYDAFLVITNKHNLAYPDFAIPIFPGQNFQEVFDVYKKYIPKKAVVDMFAKERTADATWRENIGKSCGMIRFDGDEYFIHVVERRHTAFKHAVVDWEREWRYDLMADLKVPFPTTAHFEFSELDNEEVHKVALEFYNRFWSILFGLFTLFIFTR